MKAGQNEPLTKREQFAVLILQGMVANPQMGNATELWNTDKAQKLAVHCADVLLNALDESKP